MKTLFKLLLTLLFVLNMQLLSVASYADIPHLINYQGKLTDKDNKPVSDGTHSITFRIYDVESAGTLLWEEAQSVSVSKGIFSVMLGGVTALNLAFDKPYWLELKVGTEVMSPRQRMASVGYAYATEKLLTNLPVSNLNSGTNALNSTFWRGDGTWVAPTSIKAIYDYGTSTSTYTSRSELDLKICFGTLTLGNNESKSIANLPFTNAASYVVTMAWVSYGTSAVNGPDITRNSGTQFTAKSVSVDTQTHMWIAIGT